MRLHLTGCERWAIFQGAQELGLACRCEPYGDLEIEVPGPQSGFQVWWLHLVHAATLVSQRQWLDQCSHLAAHDYQPLPESSQEQA
jgi:hypothetical protein